VQLGGIHSHLFTLSQGVEQGGTLSPTLFSVFVDGLLEDVWPHCPGVPITPTAADGAPGEKLAALMFADDFAGLAGSQAEMQALVDRVHGHYRTCRMKANVPACAVMVIKGKAKSKVKPGGAGRWRVRLPRPSGGVRGARWCR
jgi:hypothetical protein